MVGPVEIEVLGNIEELGVSHVVYRDSEGPAALMLAHGATTINLWAPPMDGGLDANLIEIAKAQIAWLDQIANQ